MKIRTGFVSNSSSSSFLIYGASIDKETIRELFENEEDYEDEKEYMSELCIKTVLGAYGFDYDDYVYIGKSPARIPENMTMGDWKEEIENECNKLFSKYDLSLEFGFHEDCSYG